MTLPWATSRERPSWRPDADKQSSCVGGFIADTVIEIPRGAKPAQSS
ncbi:hypothetical protein ACH35V_29385 [Actinomadura sp. 1N219]